MVTKSTAKKSTKRKSVVKHRSTATKKPATPVYKTFKLAPDFPPFLQPKLSRQTVYWTFLIICIIVAQLAIISVYVNSTVIVDTIR